jgi:hypothetical protein
VAMLMSRNVELLLLLVSVTQAALIADR